MAFASCGVNSAIRRVPFQTTFKMFGAVVCALLTSGAFAQVISQEHAVVQQFISTLQENFRIDWDKPPSASFNSMSEPTCFSWVTTCNPTYFSIRKKLVQRYPAHPDSRQLVESKPNITVYFIPRVERGLINTGDDDISLLVEESTSTIDSTTSGWQIGAQIFGGVTAGVGYAGIAISAGYSKSWTTGTSSSKGVSVHTTCRSGYDCRVETWTFHIKVSGHCQHQPIINCAGEMDPCAKSWSTTCHQFETFRNKHCYTCNPVSPYVHEACEVHTPVLDQVGMPFIRLVRIAEKIRPHAGAGERAGGADQRVAAKAIKEEDGWYQLDTGEWYDPKDGSYWGKRGQKWYYKPDEPTPNLSITTPDIQAKDPVLATGDAPRANPDCKAVPCWREFDHVFGTGDYLRHMCMLRRLRPGDPVVGDLAAFPFSPTCGKINRSLQVLPQDYLTVCQCLENREYTGSACPDCKLSPCYRELHYLYGSDVEIIRHCIVGDLSANKPLHADLSLPPIHPQCGKTIGTVTFEPYQVDAVCSCLEHNEFGLSDRRDRDEDDREIPEVTPLSTSKRSTEKLWAEEEPQVEITFLDDPSF
ncbi:hypothetical protein CDD83_16 [Cordyceps sp. RAO-2017]|nr:hypothetical protein CDD83_16 [Cordyceps sp. RAO-2017]